MSNTEKYLAALVSGDTTDLPAPISRQDFYLAKMCGMDVPLPEPISRNDVYLKYLAENGGGGDLPALVNAALAGDILDGKEAIDGDGNKLTGTMPDNGTVTQKLTASVTEYTIPAGKHSGGGKVSIETEEKTATPSTTERSVTPSDGKVLSKVTVEAVQTEEKSVTPTTTAQEVTPSDGKFLSKVTVGAAPGGEELQDIATAQYLFYGGTGLENVAAILPHVKKPRDVYYMFGYPGTNFTSTYTDGWKNVDTLDFSNMDTSEVNSMKGMFNGVPFNEGFVLDLSSFDTSKVLDMSSMFVGRLTGTFWTLVVGDLFKTSAVQTMESMFYMSDCGNAIDVAKTFNMQKVSSVSSMFAACKSVSGDVCFENWETPVLENMNNMFDGASNMQSFDFAGITGRVKFTREVFSRCTKLETVNMSMFDTSYVQNMYNMFYGCSVLKNIIGFSSVYNSGLGIGFPRGSVSNKYALKRLTFRTDLPEGQYAIRSAINIQYCDMERSGFNEMVGTLPDVSGLGLNANYTQITITGNPCITGTNKAGDTVETLTDEDRAAATAKGWTLVE